MMTESEYVQDSAAHLRSLMSANIDMRMRKGEEFVWRHPQHQAINTRKRFLVLLIDVKSCLIVTNIIRRRSSPTGRIVRLDPPSDCPSVGSFTDA